MLIRDTTDHASPLAVERFSAGFRLPLLMSASGRVYLAFCQPEQRDTLLDILSRSTREEDKLARSRPEVEKILEETREHGYATSVRTRRVSEEMAISVPVLVDDRVLATVAVRFSASAVPLRLAVERFYPEAARNGKDHSPALQRGAPERNAMKRILVGIKRVVDYNVRIRLKPDGSGIVTDGVKMSINPFDEIALEEALRIRERGGADEVIAISIGSERCAAAAAHRVGDGRGPGGAGGDARRRRPTAPLEPLAAATVLLKLVEREQPMLVILGKQAIDDDNSQTGQILAALWDRPQATFASKVELTGDTARVTREVDAGLETLEVDLPARGHHGPAPERTALREAAGHHEGEEEAAGGPAAGEPRRARPLARPPWCDLIRPRSARRASWSRTRPNWWRHCMARDWYEPHSHHCRTRRRPSEPRHRQVRDLRGRPDRCLDHRRRAGPRPARGRRPGRRPGRRDAGAGGGKPRQ